MGDSRVIQNALVMVDDLDYVKETCADEIDEFGVQFKNMKKLYDVLGMRYPEECNTNYRDSWFHFRKMYKKKDIISIYNEKYGLEEHLLRAAKDAQISFLQQLGYWLEVWYRNDDYMICDMSRSEEYDLLFDKLEDNWVRCILEKVGEDYTLFANACLYHYLLRIQTESVKIKLQILIHNIKNIILDLRLSGVSISRPRNNIYYMKKCVSVYNDMCISLQETGMIYLLSSTRVILNSCRREGDSKELG